MFKNTLKIGWVIVLSFIIFSGCSARATESTIETAIEEVPVRLESVISDDVYESVYTIGEIKASDSYQVNAMSSGDVTNVYYEVGEYVEEGDVLFTIETEDFEVDRESKLTQASNAMAQAKLSLDNAKTQLEDTKRLFENGISTKSQLDGAELSYDNARISYQNAVTSYNSTKHTYDSMSDNYEMKAPVAGIITSSNIIVDMFATTQNGMTIEVVEAYKIDANVPSKYVNDIEVNQNVEVYVPTLEKTYKGHVSTVSLSGKTGSYPVEIVLDEQSEDLRTGMYTELWIQISDASLGLWLPSKALIQENGESFVYTVNEGIVEKHVVEALSLRGDTIAVKSELSEDQSVIIYGKEYVIGGSKVIEK